MYTYHKLQITITKYSAAYGYIDTTMYITYLHQVSLTYIRKTK